MKLNIESEENTSTQRQVQIDTRRGVIVRFTWADNVGEMSLGDRGTRRSNP